MKSFVAKISLLFGLVYINLAAEIIIFSPAKDSCFLEKIVDFDREVSLEYFVPLYREHYSQYEFGRQPEKFLENELVSDRELFREIISRGRDDRMLLMAMETESQEFLGLILGTFQAGHLEIDLILVHSRCRRQGLGARLIATLVKAFPDVRRVSVASFNKNAPALAFYAKMGFEDHGPAEFGDKIGFYGVPRSLIYTMFNANVRDLRI